MSDEMNTSPDEKKAGSLDPYILFRQLDDMCKEGVSEEDIRAAFEQFMAERRGEFRKLQPYMRRTQDSVPMPTQEAINDLYKAQVRERSSPDFDRSGEIMGVDVRMLIDEITKARNKTNVNIVVKKKLTFKILCYRAAYFTLKPFVSAMIWVLEKIGTNDDDDRTVRF